MGRIKKRVRLRRKKIGGIYVGDVSIGTNVLDTGMEISNKIIWRRYIELKIIWDKILYMFKNVKNTNMKIRKKIK